MQRSKSAAAKVVAAKVNVFSRLWPAVCAGCVLVAAVGCESKTSQTTGMVTVFVEDAATESLPFNDVPDGATVEDVMRRISPEQLPIQITGSGVTAFVTSMDGKATTDGKGWMFTIDGQPSYVGIGSATVHPPTVVEWHYGMFEPLSEE